jgi:DNA-binding transcriptional LysR family regulator
LASLTGSHRVCGPDSAAATRGDALGRVLVAADLGVSLVPESMQQLALAGATYRRLSDVAPVARLALATTKASRSNAAENFLGLCA